LPKALCGELKAALSAWQPKVDVCLKEAMHAGEIAEAVDCKEAAAYLLWTGGEGAALRAKLECSPKALKAYVC
jgi:TetR/AcrR family transcriptional repressor of nem operon